MHPTLFAADINKPQYKSRQIYRRLGSGYKLRIKLSPACVQKTDGSSIGVQMCVRACMHGCNCVSQVGGTWTVVAMKPCSVPCSCNSSSDRRLFIKCSTSSSSSSSSGSGGGGGTLMAVGGGRAAGEPAGGGASVR